MELIQAEPPLLTIAIPTYERAQYLQRSLHALADQLDSSLIELIISDNASTDNTRAIVDAFQHSHGFPVRYIRNESNLGPDANVVQCFEQARGKYVWIMGDDDFVRPGGIAKVLPHLQTDDYDLIHIASVPFTDKALPSESMVDRGVEVFNDANLLARRVNIFFTFISGNILNKHRISSVPHAPYSELIGTYLSPLGWTYAAIDHHRRSLYIRTRLVAALTENTGGYRLFQVFGPNLQRITQERVRSPRVRRAIINGTLQRFFPPFLLAQKATHGKFVREDPHEVLAPVFSNNFRYWLFDFPIMRLPLTLARCWWLMLRVINRIDTIVGSPLLGL